MADDDNIIHLNIVDDKTDVKVWVCGCENKTFYLNITGTLHCANCSHPVCPDCSGGWLVPDSDNDFHGSHTFSIYDSDTPDSALKNMTRFLDAKGARIVATLRKDDHINTWNDGSFDSPEGVALLRDFLIGVYRAVTGTRDNPFDKDT